MSDRGILIVVSGPSGCGKSTILHRLMERRPNLRFSVSATTREPREGEKDGVHYFFVNRAEFREMIRQDAFLEYAEYVGNFYGTPRNAVELQLASGCDVYLDIEVQGANLVRSKCPEALFIFVMPPSPEELRRRLTLRGTESAETIAERLDRAEHECALRDQFDHVVINDDLERAIDEIDALIDAHKAKQASEV